MENKTPEAKNVTARPVRTVVLKVLLTLAAATVIVFAGSVLALILISGSVHMPLPYIVGLLLPALLLPLIWLRTRKKYLRFWLMALAVCAAVTAADYGAVKYDESFRIYTSSDYAEGEADPFVFLVHKDNPVDGLTAEQLRGIYSGEITNWKQLGGEDKAIKAYQNDPGSYTHEVMKDFMGGTPLMDPPTEMGYGYLYAWGEQVSNYRNKPASIGYSLRSCVEDRPEVKLLSVDGAAPTAENAENGTYPYVG